MVMTEVLDKLKALQDILAQKNIVEADIESAPKILSTQEELLARLKKGYIEKNDQYELVKKQITHFKAQLFEAETMRENSEKAMDNISTQREYEALDKEIREAGERELNYRKEMQKEERLYAELDEQLKNEEALIKQQEEELDERKSKISLDIEELTKTLKKLIIEEEKIVPGIHPETRFKLERIIKSKQGVGIVAIQGNVCNGCHMILPAQFANEVRIGNEILYCPYCSRILYYQENIEGEGDFFDNDDAGSLADLDDFSDEDDDEDDREEDTHATKMDYEE